ncbi:hypothetical protein [Bacillus sp. B1-b2]|uniref:hypothetical protein n=1 Tax=Bacillus sp. B1-b2 TaxID=2653201 RepID=UPI00126201B5|nr:hypothetical protein [Bacillus sp. B1-b2]KAB7672232.1 hypothetical protein F9279_04780 [Bacillus sp. B1-b2]
MVNLIRKMKLMTAYVSGGIFYLLTIVLHLLVIVEKIPFTWVNGGRTESFALQLRISMISIIITVCLGFIFLIITRIKRNQSNRVVNILVWLLVLFYTIGFIQQMLGTPFEKIVCSVILLLGILSHLRLALEK